MFNKVLIANRGEIAIRVIRACKELGIKSVAVYSTQDENALHTVFADEAVCIGPSSSTQSYLNATRIISAAEITGADAVHPGYGFLSENSEFADMCNSCEITFIGPSSEVIRRMGDKAEAKKSMAQAGVPVIPGSDGIVQKDSEAREMAKELGYPVILKAVAGGGGKGMRIVKDPKSLENSYMMAKAEAEAAFGNSDLYLEKYIESPRHIEIQLVGDQEGNMIYLGERECSIQRRHQKLIEESPSPIITDKIRKIMGETAVKGALHVGYYSTGTIEYLVDKDLNYYFMEMNTRIQVEHPVTEMVYQVDLIKEQIKVAAGETLTLKQNQLKPVGHSIECRINAEDPSNNFIPSPGEVTSFYQPGGPGTRVDTHIYASYQISPYYDSLIAKLVVWGKDRQESISRLNRALDEFVVEGIKTTIPFHKYVISTPEFLSGEFDTHFIEKIYRKELIEI
ncbi:MAG: acetyl-CoA carboxylase biotin carboxylase subunit [Calditrichia bacterium]|nr:acetyl-CoA carboxylase biotin carboxylase subunit [Calditrichia bacterium]MCK5455445.1 acetyl-CoA carboxylase biotin carboxylase subunit [Calditrichia bacterium]